MLLLIVFGNRAIRVLGNLDASLQVDRQTSQILPILNSFYAITYCF